MQTGRVWRWGLVALLSVLALAVNAQADMINCNVYTGFTDTGSSLNFSNYKGSLTTPDVSLGTSTGYAWHPFGLEAFGADFFGGIVVGSNEPNGSNWDYWDFTLTSRGPSYLFIDGNLFIDNGGEPGSNVVARRFWAPKFSFHVFELQFCCPGGGSGVDLWLYNDSHYCPAPLPSTLLLLGSGLLGLAGLRSKFRKV